MSIVTEALSKAQKNRLKESKEATREKEISPVEGIFRIKEVPESISNKKVQVSGKFYLIVFLFISIVIFFAGLFFFPKVKGDVPQENSITSHVLSESKVNVGSPLVEASHKTAVPFSETKKDPVIIKADNNKSKAPLPVLNGIMFTSDHPTAILNDKIVSTGDMLSGFKIIKISPDSVEISNTNDTYRLDLR